MEKNESKIKIDIYQGLPKSEKMELIIQKSVELGANSIIPVSMKRCVVKLSGKDEIKKIERYFEKIFIIKKLKNFKKMLDKKTIIHYNL